MRPLFLSLLLTLFLYSCGNFKKLEVYEIRTAYLEYNRIQAINFGGEIEARVIAIMNDGSEVDITRNRKLNLISDDIIRSGNFKEFKIIKHPKSFTENTANIEIIIKDKESVFQITDSIRINFKGDLIIDANGINGFDGVNQKNSRTPILFRDGKHGEDGTDGGDGKNAEIYTSKFGLKMILLIFI